MDAKTVTQVLHDPLAQELMAADIPARLAYTGPDGFPRVVPVGFHWDGSRIIVGTATNSPKVAALIANPKVALTVDTAIQPPKVLLVRGTVTVDVVDGVFPEYLAGAKKHVGAERMPEFEATVRGIYPQMARLTVVPEWAKLLDFETRLPSFLEELIARSDT
ncbi:MAG: pyridoxamine 5-phosphate oxidase [Streptosporangiales bacterium]|nr:pyridoxamine 5-phosphate oxidase [Streptosporangiales bacterium]